MGLSEYFDSMSDMGVCFPLTALVDYRGFRLVAMTVLPLNETTQIYGSNNAGKTVGKKKKIFEDIFFLIL